MTIIIWLLSLLLLIALPQIGFSQYFNKSITDSHSTTYPYQTDFFYTNYSASSDVSPHKEQSSSTYLLNCYISFSYWLEHHKQNQSPIAKESMVMSMPVAWSLKNLIRPIDLSPAIKLVSIQ
jgi:hypothetical protein